MKGIRPACSYISLSWLLAFLLLKAAEFEYWSSRDKLLTSWEMRFSTLTLFPNLLPQSKFLSRYFLHTHTYKYVTHEKEDIFFAAGGYWLVFSFFSHPYFVSCFCQSHEPKHICIYKLARSIADESPPIIKINQSSFDGYCIGVPFFVSFLFLCAEQKTPFWLHLCCKLTGNNLILMEIK